MTVPTVATKVRAGDWVGVLTTTRTAYANATTETRVRWDLARVTRATRDGVAVEWEDGRGYRMGASGSLHPIPHDKVSREACARLAAQHTYPDSVIVRGWDSRADLVADLLAVAES